MHFQSVDLGRLNSLTKYPSIETYHALAKKGRLAREVNVAFAAHVEVIATEKVDGTNARVIMAPDGSFIVGSREDLLYASGDLLFNPANSIVAALKSVVGIDGWTERIQRLVPHGLLVVYGEVYGGKVHKNSRNYTRDKSVLGFRLFDAFRLDEPEELLSREPSEISLWRQQGGQPFHTEDVLRDVATTLGVQLTPRLQLEGPLPTEHEPMLALLERLVAQTHVALDESGEGAAEGVVFRTVDRTSIAKARFEDYRRTLR